MLKILKYAEDKGKEQGRSEERRELVEKLLTKKFGNLPEELTEKNHLMNDPLLEVLSLEILDFQSFEDLNGFINRMNL